ncbi:MAG: RagB/SusD family nutrient uptake outer membrane protein [Deltaproteobacteria bacterium]|nr:MAG: RagB/SusD family nutrient uptake outer membrane protein [Deltaproteobacteria bacterium]
MRPPAEGVAECSNGTVPPTPAVRYSKDITHYQTFIGAEANIALNNTGPAIADIDLIWVQSGGLAASSGLNSSNIFDELLKQKRYSLLFEGGHRWIDLRRYGKLDASHVAIDTTDDVIHAAFPIPLTESQTP